THAAHGPHHGRRNGLTGALSRHLSDHARNAAGPPTRRFDLVLQEAPRRRTGIARSQIGPSPAFGISLTRRLAGGPLWIGGHLEVVEIAPIAVDGILGRSRARFDHAGTAHSGHAA